MSATGQKRTGVRMIAAWAPWDAWPARNRAKLIARDAGGISPRAVQHWFARRRQESLDAALHLAAHNEEYRAAMLARIEQIRSADARDAQGQGGGSASAGRGADAAPGGVAGGAVPVACGPAGPATDVAGGWGRA